MDETDIGSKNFLAILDTSNEWILSKVEYGPVEKPVVVMPEEVPLPVVPESNEDVAVGIGIGIGGTLVIGMLLYYVWKKLKFENIREEI